MGRDVPPRAVPRRVAVLAAAQYDAIHGVENAVNAVELSKRRNDDRNQARSLRRGDLLADPSEPVEPWRTQFVRSWRLSG